MPASSVPEAVHETDLIRFPWPWGFRLPKAHIIIVNDGELRTIANDPDAVIDMSLTLDKVEGSLRGVCADAQSKGCRTLILAFDHFFGQYRPGQSGARALTPDRPEAIELIGRISRFAKDFGLGLELSLLSPIEIGPGAIDATGEGGRWFSVRKGLRDPRTGRFSIQYWRHERWANNKGPIDLEDLGVRVFAFPETPIPESPYRVVDPEKIIEVTECARIEEWDLAVEHPGVGGDFRARRVRVHGTGRTGLGPEYNRVVAVQMTATPEMDYFSPKSAEFLRSLVDQYKAAGVELNALYSDEMHIQSAWNYFSLHENGQYTHRYASKGFEKAFAAKHGAAYGDFAKWMVYFVHGQEEHAHDLVAMGAGQHIPEGTAEGAAQAALFRARYYELLQGGVVDLFAGAKAYAEEAFGRKLEARAHATWAESPTIDLWDAGPRHHSSIQYDYGPDFVWSCTAHQAAAACHDYFKWGEYLSGGGTDHPECGWSDRNYYGPALACSLGALNDVPYAYCAHWGMPKELSRCRRRIEAAYGTSYSEDGSDHSLVQEMGQRIVDVLFLYPLDLVAATERFGSWMVQYGYADLITPEKLLAEGRVEGGRVVVRGRSYGTIAALFEPIPRRGLLDFLKGFAESGGTLVWSGPPPVIDRAGRSARGDWESLFGVACKRHGFEGWPLPGCEVRFEGALSSVPAQAIPSHFPVDRVHPLEPLPGTEVVARAKDLVCGTARSIGEGRAIALGFRPRDDQSAHLGREIRTWFEILRVLGSHGGDDSPEVVSRTTDFLACRFANGAISIALHHRRVEEGWEGGFGRDDAKDAEYLEANPPPAEDLVLRGLRVAGHVVDYEGIGAVSFRLDGEGCLLAFAGEGCAAIRIDGREWRFADAPVEHLHFGPVPAAQRVEGGALLIAKASSPGRYALPAPGLPEAIAAVAEGAAPGSRGEPVAAKRDGAVLVLEVDESAAGRRIFVVSA